MLRVFIVLCLKKSIGNKMTIFVLLYKDFFLVITKFKRGHVTSEVQPPKGMSETRDGVDGKSFDFVSNRYRRSFPSRNGVRKMKLNVRVKLGITSITIHLDQFSISF